MAEDTPEEPPAPPESLPTYLAEGVPKQSVATLEELAAYATAVADWKAAQAERELAARTDREADDVPAEWNEEEWDEAVREARADGDVPAGKGTLTVKTIEGNDYYYLQWREGETVRSKYVAPVDPSD